MVESTNASSYSWRFTVTKIEELLPQRYPFLFLDEIEWATKAEIKMFGRSLKGADVSLKGSVHLP